MGDAEELLMAAQKNDLAKAKAILDRNPSLLRMRTPNGTLVLTATFYGASDVLKLLLAQTPEDALNLYEAATVGNARRLKTILGQSRVRVNEPTPEEGFDPLGLAAFFGHSEAVKVLLEHGADVNQKPPSRFANTAVDSAVAGDHTDVVRILLAAGANPNVRSEA
ncbi:MAG TPA: ankyrin repeat domain-containing protein, partial [Thermoplasmata archaeon]|nr:ankyrin repeat domain-containing protein [Thermoplasmata archaeon]